MAGAFIPPAFVGITEDEFYESANRLQDMNTRHGDVFDNIDPKNSIGDMEYRKPGTTESQAGLQKALRDFKTTVGGKQVGRNKKKDSEGEE